MWMKRIIFIAALILSLGQAYGQGYTNAAGIRASWLSPGLEYRFYPSDMNSYKVLLATRDHGIQLHGLVEFYQYDLFPFSRQIIFLYGLGVHAGYESWDVRRSQGNEVYYDWIRWIGRTGICFLRGSADGRFGGKTLFRRVWQAWI